MALDETLLREAGEMPVLRTYRWIVPTLSFGYFLKQEDARQALHPGETMVRRWTGGGLVHHAGATTWSLIVPHRHPFATIRPAASYARLHQAVAQMLQQAGWAETAVVPTESPAPAGGICAEAPAPGDVTWQGKKLAGAGQRRTRQGLLHQGVIFLPEEQLPEAYPNLLGSAMAGAVLEYGGEIPSTTKTADRYASTHWNSLR